MSRLLGEFGGTEELAKEPPINWLIPGWLPSRELSVLYGAPGSFKSFIAQGWSCQLAKSGYRTLYVAAEGLSGLRPRVDAWRARNLRDAHMDIPNWSYYNANVWMDDPNVRQNWVDGLLEYYEKKASSREARDVKKVLPNIIFVDTLARNFLGDENSAKEMGMFVEGVERIRRSLGCAILVVHHTTKSNKNVERGTEALRAASFAMHRTSKPTGRPKRGGGSVLLECDRMKDGETPQEVRIEFDRFDLDSDEHGQVYRYSLAMGKFPPLGGNLPTPVTSGNSGAGGSGGKEPDSPRSKGQRAISGLSVRAIEIARDNGGKLRARDLRSGAGVGKTTATKTLNSLVNKGFFDVHGDPPRTYYELNEDKARAIGLSE